MLNHLSLTTPIAAGAGFTVGFFLGEQISKMTKRTPPKIQQKIIADNKTGKYTHLQIG